MSARSRNQMRSRLEALEDRQLLAAAIPIFHSNPTASKTLYLDFDGHFEEDYGDFDDVRTPPMNFDGTAATLSPREWGLIQDVWGRVAEDFAPFDIDVTTEQPAHMRDGREMRIAFGGTWSDWYDAETSGIHIGETFLGDEPNVTYVFSEYIGPNAAALATTASHEAGHAFGLEHQSTYDAEGDRIDEYSMGGADWTPIMGNNLSTDRTLWWHGTSAASIPAAWVPDPAPGFEVRGDRAIRLQDDMRGLGDRLGWRADDHGASLAASTRLRTLDWSGGTSDSLSARGIVGSTSDQDFFTFRVARAGAFRARLDVITRGANLDARIDLGRVTAAGWVPVAAAAPADDLGATMEQWLAPGEYVLIAGSQGSYGDVGQYTLGLSLARDAAAPYVTNVTLPPGSLDRRTMRIHFNEPIDAASFTADDIRLLAPDGTRVPVTIVSNVFRRVFTVRVPAPTQFGRYLVAIGPNLRDTSGHAMNQDGDRTYGEAIQDMYLTSYYVPPPPPAEDRPPLPGGALPPGLVELAQSHWDLQTLANLFRNGPPSQLLPAGPIVDRVESPAGGVMAPLLLGNGSFA
jgi:hypothetical protein